MTDHPIFPKNREAGDDVRTSGSNCGVNAHHGKLRRSLPNRLTTEEPTRLGAIPPACPPEWVVNGGETLSFPTLQIVDEARPQLAPDLLQDRKSLPFLQLAPDCAEPFDGPFPLFPEADCLVWPV